MDNPLVLFIVFPLVAYVIGSTPFGMIIARFHGVDLRAKGSGNVGATNVGRVIGRKWGLVCFGLDVAKGAIPTLIAGRLLMAGGAELTNGVQLAWLGVGMGCIFGHVLSFYLRFRGGKGVATSLGVVLGVFPYFTWPGLAAFGLWIIVTGISRYVSLSSICAAVAFCPLLLCFNWFLYGKSPADIWPLATFAALMAALLVYLHRTNITRLLAGIESKIGSKAK